MIKYSNLPLSLDQANQAIAQYHLSGGTARAVRLYLAGICPTQKAAADQVDVSPSILARALRRMSSSRRCACCGQVSRRIEVQS